MKRKRYAEEQIISILKEVDAGASVPDVSRRHGIAENTIYRWKSKFGGMEVSEAKRLRELEGENAKLKRLLAEAERDQGSPERARTGKMVTAAQRRRAVEHLTRSRLSFATSMSARRVEALGGSVSLVGAQRRGAAHPAQSFS